jgi:hypothetical protein
LNPQVKLIGKGLGGISPTPTKFEPGAFLRSQGHRKGYTNEPSPMGLYFILFYNFTKKNCDIYIYIYMVIFLVYLLVDMEFCKLIDNIKIVVKHR